MGCSQVVRQRTLTPLFVGSSPPIPVYLLILIMVIEIQFIEGIKELTLPIVRLTKSRNGETGTATFIFIKPEIFKEYISQISTINGMYLIWDNKKIISQDIYILFKNGEPFLIKTIFIFKNSNEWFQFLNFMNSYSKETGLLFG